MTVYQRQIDTAIRLIKAKGESVTWRQYPDGVPADLDKPWIPGDPASSSFVGIPIVFLPLNRINTELLKALSAANELKTGDLYGLMASVAFVPSDKDVVIRTDGSVCRITSIDTLAPDGTPILYTINFKL